MEKINIIDIKLPDYNKVHRGDPGEELIVTFRIGDDKFRCVYIQEHYIYCGMPGVSGEQCSFSKIERGEVKSTIVCNGEFRIPHDKNLVAAAYADNPYYGNDPRFLLADEETVRKYLIEPFVKRYY